MISLNLLRSGQENRVEFNSSSLSKILASRIVKMDPSDLRAYVSIGIINSGVKMLMNSYDV